MTASAYFHGKTYPVRDASAITSTADALDSLHFLRAALGTFAVGRMLDDGATPSDLDDVAFYLWQDIADAIGDAE